ncbi:MAG: hypothetical protein QHH00_00135 [Methanomassiliicoccales archaeon]|jgi:hypothetical protein|nr:hypothetical protein [Methanomassiliicoccales archaeon]
MKKKIIGIVMSPLLVALLLTMVAISSSVQAVGMGQTAQTNFCGDSDQNCLGFQSGKQMTQEQMRERIMEMCQIGLQRRLFGPVEYDNGTVTGFFIAFNFDESTGTITNYSVREGDEMLRVFENIEISDFTSENVKVIGSIFVASDETHRVIAHNNPTALLHIMAKGPAEISITIPEDFEIQQVSSNNTCLDVVYRITKDNFVGAIGVSNGTASLVENGEGTYLNVSGNDTHLFFRMRPYFHGTGLGMQSQLMNAVVGGRICAEIRVMVHNGDTIYDAQVYDHRYTFRIVSAAQNRVTVQVASEQHEGRLFLFMLDNDTISVSNQLRVKLDGSDVAKANDMDEILNATGTSTSDARYYGFEIDGLQYVLVYVPHFSEHTIEISSLATSAGIPVTWIAVAVIGIGAVVTAAAVLAKGGRKQ